GFVRSQAIPKRLPSLQENLLSYESRNYNFLKSERHCDPKVFGEAMAMAVLKKCFNLEKFATLRDEVIGVSELATAQWAAKRDENQLRNVFRDFERRHLDIGADVSNFSLMVKRDAKVKLDDSCLTKHAPAQNIMYHRKAINALYSPFFDEFKNRLLWCLNSNIVFFTEMSNSDFASVVRRHVGDEDIFYKGEVDFSKFDKSQDAFIKEYERALYSAFGFDAEMLELWMYGEYRAHATTTDGSLSFDVKNQRRSGGANTWIGNSIVTLGILAMYYEVDRFKLLTISGDDSLIYSNTKIANHSTQICLETGFETKFMTPSVPYFCSKFVVHTGSFTYFVPDPYKLLVKLGAPSKYITDAGLFETFVSFRDLTRDLNNQLVVERVAMLVEEKYNFKSGFTIPAICALHCLRSNFLSYSKLFPVQRGFFNSTYSEIRSLRRLVPGLLVTAYRCAGEKRYFSYLKSSIDEDPPPLASVVKSY
ncbi:RdRp, partial [Rose leaf rosette-associated virus]